MLGNRILTCNARGFFNKKQHKKGFILKMWSRDAVMTLWCRAKLQCISHIKTEKKRVVGFMELQYEFQKCWHLYSHIGLSLSLSLSLSAMPCHIAKKFGKALIDFIHCGLAYALTTHFNRPLFLAIQNFMQHLLHLHARAPAATLRILWRGRVVTKHELCTTNISNTFISWPYEPSNPRQPAQG